MIQRAIIIGLLVFCNLYLGAQNYINYFNLTNEAEYSVNNKEYQKAIYLYQKAFQLEKPLLGKDLYLFAKCYAILKKSKKASFYLKKAALYTGSYPSVFMQRDSLIFNKCFSTKRNRKLSIKLNKIEVRRSQLVGNDHKIKSMRDTVNYFIREDQLYRKHPKKELYRADTLDIESKSFFREWELHDSILYEKFIDYVKSNGYPEYNVIGTDIASILLLHVSVNQYERLKIILYGELKKGKILPFHYASMIDRKEYQYGNSCKYYIYKNYCTEDHYGKIIKDRLAIGLSAYYNGPRKFPFEESIVLPWVVEIRNLQK